MEIGLYDLKTNLSGILKKIEETGESVQVTRHGVVVAELSPVKPGRKVPGFGCFSGEGYEMSADFDEEGLGWEDFFARGPGTGTHDGGDVAGVEGSGEAG